jgi:hypothetical protein
MDRSHSELALNRWCGPLRADVGVAAGTGTEVTQHADQTGSNAESGRVDSGRPDARGLCGTPIAMFQCGPIAEGEEHSRRWP